MNDLKNKGTNEKEPRKQKEESGNTITLLAAPDWNLSNPETPQNG
jgi:hypothetical protein